jgi:hypothetical protein
MPLVAVRFGVGAVVLSGITAGVIFIVFELLAAGYVMGPTAAAFPLRMVAAIVAGPDALGGAYPLAIATTIGMVVHLVLSILFTALFASMVAPIRHVAHATRVRTSDHLALAGAMFGAVLWVVNFHVVAPLAGWTWFATGTDPFVQLLAHAVFFGCPMGWMLERSRSLIKIP